MNPPDPVQLESEAQDRRRAEQRRESARISFYRTRREWLLAEAIIGIVSCATALTALTGGIVFDTLAETSNNTAWFFCFYSSGGALLVLSFVEHRCRSNGCGREVLTRYAYMRFAALSLNFFSWGIGFLWLHFSEVYVPAVYYEGIPLSLFAFIGIIEHAKALWLVPRRAGTTSMWCAGFRFLRGSR